MSLRLGGVEGVSDVTPIPPNGKVNPPPISLIKLREELILLVLQITAVFCDGKKYV